MGITSNPVLANGIAGLATSATAQATIEVGHRPGRPLLGEGACGKWWLYLAIVLLS